MLEFIDALLSLSPFMFMVGDIFGGGSGGTTTQTIQDTRTDLEKRLSEQAMQLALEQARRQAAFQRFQAAMQNPGLVLPSLNLSAGTAFPPGRGSVGGVGGGTTGGGSAPGGLATSTRWGPLGDLPLNFAIMQGLLSGFKPGDAGFDANLTVSDAAARGIIPSTALPSMGLPPAPTGGGSLGLGGTGTPTTGGDIPPEDFNNPFSLPASMVSPQLIQQLQQQQARVAQANQFIDLLGQSAGNLRNQFDAMRVSGLPSSSPAFSPAPPTPVFGGSPNVPTFAGTPSAPTLTAPSMPMITPVLAGGTISPREGRLASVGFYNGPIASALSDTAGISPGLGLQSSGVPTSAGFGSNLGFGDINPKQTYSRAGPGMWGGVGANVQSDIGPAPTTAGFGNVPFDINPKQTYSRPSSTGVDINPKQTYDRPGAPGIIGFGPPVLGSNTGLSDVTPPLATGGFGGLPTVPPVPINEPGIDINPKQIYNRPAPSGQGIVGFGPPQIADGGGIDINPKQIYNRPGVNGGGIDINPKQVPTGPGAAAPVDPAQFQSPLNTLNLDFQLGRLLTPEQSAALETMTNAQRTEAQRQTRQRVEEAASARGLRVADTPISQPLAFAVAQQERDLAAQKAQAMLGLQQQAFVNRAQMLGQSNQLAQQNFLNQLQAAGFGAGQQQQNFANQMAVQQMMNQLAQQGFGNQVTLNQLGLGNQQNALQMWLAALAGQQGLSTGLFGQQTGSSQFNPGLGLAGVLGQLPRGGGSSSVNTAGFPQILGGLGGFGLGLGSLSNAGMFNGLGKWLPSMSSLSNMFGSSGASAPLSMSGTYGPFSDLPALSSTMFAL